MAAISTEERRVIVPMKHQTRESSQEETKIQIQPQPETEKRVAVVYYLSRNGQLEHPHFMEVPLSSSQGLYLRDVINTLNILRGQGMASMYSWASKRSYKNAFLWQDLSDDDLIHPCHDQDYVLKGSLLFESSLSFRSNNSISSSSSDSSSTDGEDSNSPLTRRKNHSFGSVDDIDEHKIFRAKTAGELAIKGSNASTQTDDSLRTKKKEKTKEAEPEGVNNIKLKQKKVPETISKSAEVYRSASSNVRYQKIGRANSSARKDESKFLMKLIGCGCGSKRFKDFEMMENSH